MINYNLEKAKNVFNQANGFFKFVNGMIFKKGDILYLNPFYINCLFACELYLKTLLVLKGFSSSEIKDRSHDIKSLFDALDEEDQISIKNILTAEIQDDVLSFLDSIKKDFTDMRYMYINEDEVDENCVNNKFAKCIQLMYRLQYHVSLKLYGKDTYEDVINNVSI